MARYRVLLVESSEAIQAQLKPLLESMHFEVEIALTALDALYSMIVNRPTLVIISSNLKDMSGYQLSYIFKQHPDFKNIPTILSTTFEHALERAKSKAMRVDKTLKIPCTKQSLENAISGFGLD